MFECNRLCFVPCDSEIFCYGCCVFFCRFVDLRCLSALNCCGFFIFFSKRRAVGSTVLTVVSFPLTSITLATVVFTVFSAVVLSFAFFTLLVPQAVNKVTASNIVIIVVVL